MTSHPKSALFSDGAYPRRQANARLGKARKAASVDTVDTHHEELPLR
ncbi:hypothetical protein [Collimonas arenae]|nr:hypothetical protein [Collimonas arenae]